MQEKDEKLISIIAEESGNNEYIAQLIQIVSTFSGKQLADELLSYHANDIADLLPLLTKEQRKTIYSVLSDEDLSDIFSYLEDPAPFVEELSSEKAADIIEEMDSGDAVDLLEELNEEKKQELIELLDEEAAQDVALITGYEDDEIGSKMTTDYAQIYCDMSIKAGMRKVIADAADTENITTIFVTDKNDCYMGAIRLRDLVIARAGEQLNNIIISEFPHLNATDKIADVLEDIKEYAEHSLPVLDADNRLIGALTSEDVMEAVDEDLTDDYARLAGLSDTDEDEKGAVKSIFSGVVNRLPWLIVLLVLDIFIGAYIGVFEAVVVGLPFIVSFQQLISAMCGNTGTQTLAVTVRALSDDDLSGKKQRQFVLKELKAGFLIGLIMGIATAAVVCVFALITQQGSLDLCLKISFAVGFSMLTSTTVSSLTSCLIPITLNKLKIDPAVASGPLITTLNDLIAITLYYGTALILIL